jgi:hypothetical protein
MASFTIRGVCPTDYVSVTEARQGIQATGASIMKNVHTIPWDTGLWQRPMGKMRLRLGVACYGMSRGDVKAKPTGCGCMARSLDLAP